ncbi:unnamed protein product [Blepharisma stoltei]|uniref:Uncharacterized protein n=1 Tax=Blepharisma stoltei TaxID=1481888 RepID=A0AAU9JQW9_9CILI|nr:unnamed protein product [Blepharisma stoltei]
MEKNIWAELKPMPWSDDSCHAVMYNGGIFISGYEKQNLLRYSIDTETLRVIPFQFGEKKRKILINLDRLYVIESFNGFIYESQIGDEFMWKKIGRSILGRFCRQVYWSYNKGAIYIKTSSKANYRFILNQNTMSQLL